MLTFVSNVVRGLRSPSALTLLIFGCGFAAPAAPAPKPSQRAAFFPFCIDWHDSKKRDFTQQAQMLKELGYEGVGHIWLDKVAERIQSLDAAGLKLYQITMTLDIAPGKQAYDPKLKDVLQLVKGRGVQFDLLISGMKPSDPAGDERAVAILRELAELGKAAGAEFLLYPHVGNWTERIEDCVRVADKVDRPEVGVMFNLCHWLRVSSDRDYASRLKQAMPRLMAVSLNGADEWDSNQGWAKYIQPLGRGSFDVSKLLQTLRELGFKGPVGLQCYGIEGDTHDHLQESMLAWRRLNRPASARTLSADEATALARRLANEKAQALYGSQPFQAAQPAQLFQGIWLWRDRQGKGRVDLEATVKFARDGAEPTATVLMLDNRAEPILTPR